MNYFKDKNGNVSAYDDEQLLKVSRITELEELLALKEPIFIESRENLIKKQETLNMLIEQCDGIDESFTDEIERLNNQVLIATNERDEALHDFSLIESQYNQLKDEYDAILPAFFNIREDLKTFKKMTTKEIEMHTNPPKSKEQHIAEAEMQKQLCAEDAEKNITILERKVRLSMATEADKNSLTAWEIYSIKIADIDTSLAPDINFPAKPE